MKVTGVLPLYLFHEHWQIAKRKLQPLYGFMFTHDVMGFSHDQYMTLAFTVLTTALKKYKNTNAEGKRILRLIQETCEQMIV